MIKSTILKITDVNDHNRDLEDILTHGSWWETAYKPLSITFIDLIKDIVPINLSNKIHSITNNNEVTTEVLFQTYDLIYRLTQEIWLERCIKVVDIEQSKNITIREIAYTVDKMVTLSCYYSNF